MLGGQKLGGVSTCSPQGDGGSGKGSKVRRLRVQGTGKTGELGGARPVAGVSTGAMQVSGVQVHQAGFQAWTKYQMTLGDSPWGPGCPPGSQEGSGQGPGWEWTDARASLR